jgi:hypothetical protein
MISPLKVDNLVVEELVVILAATDVDDQVVIAVFFLQILRNIFDRISIGFLYA